jgi:hypothetical protein
LEHPHTISFVVANAQGLYYADSEWREGLGEASLFSRVAAERKLAESDLRHPLRLFCVIQNKDFDFYDGAGWVYRLSEAKLYGPEEAKKVLSFL